MVVHRRPTLTDTGSVEGGTAVGGGVATSPGLSRYASVSALKTSGLQQGRHGALKRAASEFTR